MVLKVSQTFWRRVNCCQPFWRRVNCCQTFWRRVNYCCQTFWRRVNCCQTFWRRVDYCCKIIWRRFNYCQTFWRKWTAVKPSEESEPLSTVVKLFREEWTVNCCQNVWSSKTFKYQMCTYKHMLNMNIGYWILLWTWNLRRNHVFLWVFLSWYVTLFAALYRVKKCRFIYLTKMTMFTLLPVIMLWL